MENASKALIMAGSLLISLMIISALMLMFNNLTTYQDTKTQTTREAQVIEFNNQFSTYDRENVRGSDLYSLLNRVIDYNRRKSTAGTGENDEGASLAYQEMTINFKIDREELKYDVDGNNYLFTGSNEYKVSGSTNTFETEIYQTIKGLEIKTFSAGGKTYKYNEKILQDLCAGVSKVFIEEPTGTEEQRKNEKIKAFQSFNGIFGGTVLTYEDVGKINDSWKLIGPIGSNTGAIRKDVYTYYEYIQFKRAIFKCTNVKYNDKTGRIISMDFEFTGKFE